MPGAVRDEVQAINPALPVFGAETLDDVVSASVAVRRFSMRVIELFALTALLLATLGIYGVVAYAVRERTHEIGVRVALGAHQADVMRLVMGQAISLAVIGAVIGLVVGAAASRAMADVLFGVRPMESAERSRPRCCSRRSSVCWVLHTGKASSSPRSCNRASFVGDPTRIAQNGGDCFQHDLTQRFNNRNSFRSSRRRRAISMLSPSMIPRTRSESPPSST